MGSRRCQSKHASQSLSGAGATVLALVPGAYGSQGGIAQFNRDLFQAMAASPAVSQIVVLPRLADRIASDPLPPRLTQLPAPVTQIAYAVQAIGLASPRTCCDVVFCGHINLTALAVLAAGRAKAKLWLQVHGIEAWTKPSYVTEHAAMMSDLVTSVSRFTRTQMLHNWWWDDPAGIKVLPNTIGSKFSPGPKSAALVQRYRLHGRRVMLSVSRLASAEAYKGHDRVIAALPRIREQFPDLVYLVVGDGDDSVRLMQLAQQYDQEQHVIFAGIVPDDELVDHYRTADVFVMPSTREGFGIVFLEAAACGLPVIGGNRDGSWDALREGLVGCAIDPTNEDEIVSAVVRALVSPRREISRYIEALQFQNFQAHVVGILDNLLPTSGGRAIEHYN